VGPVPRKSAPLPSAALRDRLEGVGTRGVKETPLALRAGSNKGREGAGRPWRGPAPPLGILRLRRARNNTDKLTKNPRLAPESDREYFMIRFRLPACAAVVLATALSGCVGTDVMMTSADQAVIQVSGAPACSPTGIQHLAYHDAAVATLQFGFDSFIIDGVQGGDELAGVSFSNGNAFANYSHSQNLTVDMFHYGDAGAHEGINARGVLGANWQQKVAAGFPHSCLG
jgi:hypothetical protein